MARLTLNQIMTQISSTVNQEAVAPTAGGDEFLLWLEYINRSLFEWSQATDWEVLRTTYYPPVLGTSIATVTMPLDFRKLAAEPRLYGQITEGTPFPEIPQEQIGLYNSTDKFVTVRGDMSSGFNIIFHPATLASGASLEIQYFSMPTSLTSATQVPIIPDSQFLIDRTVAYIFEARSDARFQLEEQKAREKLLNMVENNTAGHYSSYAGPNPVMSTNQKTGFRIGRN